MGMGAAKEAVVVFVGIPATMLIVGAAIVHLIQRPMIVERSVTIPVLTLSEAASANPPASTETVIHVPDVADIPHAFTVVPTNGDHTAVQKLADADAIIARWKKWSARPTAEVIPFADYRNARYNLTSITSSDPEYEMALGKARELDSFGVALANAEIRVAQKLRADAAAKQAALIDNDVEGRRVYAKRLEENFLRARMDATVTLEGEKGTTLRVKYVLFTRPLMFNLQEERKLIPDIIEQAKAKGFRKLIMWNGYDLSWTWNLKRET